MPKRNIIRDSYSETKSKIILGLSSSQNVNLTDATIAQELDFSTVLLNNITGAQSYSTIDINGTTRTGVLLLPKGVYRMALKINFDSVDNKKKNVAAYIVTYDPYDINLESCLYGYSINSSAHKATMFSNLEYSFTVIDKSTYFGVNTVRMGNNGDVMSIPNESGWVIEKIE